MMVIFYVSLLVATSNALGCRDEQGHLVDWWFAYKRPHGYTFGYRDSNTASTGALGVPDLLLNETNTALAKTLDVVRKNRKKYAFAVWNDEIPDDFDANRPPSQTSHSPYSYAHSKGVWAAEVHTRIQQDPTGFLLTHSLPKFPDLSLDDFVWTGDDTYGQNFLCITLHSPVDAAKAVNQLQYNWPQVYDYGNPANSEDVYPAWSTFLNGDKNFSDWNVEEIDVGETKFWTFGRNGKLHQWLYEDIVSPYFDQDFQWETWRRGSGSPLASFCHSKHDYSEENVSEVVVGSPNDSWTYIYDHSKWGVTLDTHSHHVCIGDINRMQSQKDRGGGTVCSSDYRLYGALRSTILSVDKCRSSKGLAKRLSTE